MSLSVCWKRKGVVVEGVLVEGVLVEGEEGYPLLAEEQEDDSQRARDMKQEQLPSDFVLIVEEGFHAASSYSLYESESSS